MSSPFGSNYFKDKPQLSLVIAFVMLLLFFSWAMAVAGGVRHTVTMSRTIASDSLIIITGGPKILCPESSRILIASPAPDGATYQWFRNGQPIQNEVSSSYTTDNAGTYHVKVTTAKGVTNYPAVTLTAGTGPTASFDHTADGSCSSSPVGFTSTSTGSGLTYLWDFGDPNSGRNNTSSAPNPKHKFVGETGSGDQTYTVGLTVTNKDGCSSTATATISMKQRPGTELTGTSTTFQGQPYFTGCGGGPAVMTFQNGSTTAATNTDYLIKWGDRSADYHVSSFSSVEHTYAPGTYRMTFIVAGKNCRDTVSYNVFVGSSPTVGLGDPGNTTICTGTPLIFPVTNTRNNPPGTIYTVTFGDNSPRRTYTSAPDTIMHYFNRSSCGAHNGNYNNSFLVNIIASDPCGTASAAVAPIYVSQKPDAQFTLSKDINCVNNTVTFTNSKPGTEVINGICKNSVFVWSITPKTGWDANAGDLGDDRSGSPNADLWRTGSLDLPVTFTVPGTYTVKLKVGSTNCGADSITRTVCINPAPIASFTTDVVAGCGPLIVRTTNTSPSPNCGVNSYRWTVSPNAGFTFINGTSATSTNPEISFNDAGNYTLLLAASDPNGECTSAQVSEQISVSARPTVTQPQNYRFTSGNPSGLISFTGTPGAAFNWTNDNTNIGLGSAGAGNISFTARNTTNAALVATITVIPVDACTGEPVTFTITVDPVVPVGITANGAPVALRTVYGTPSTATGFHVTATGLPAGVVVNPPDGFEVSTDGVSYTASVPISGNGETALFFRLSAVTGVGNYEGMIEFLSGDHHLDVMMPTGTVDPAPLTITLEDRTRTYGMAFTNGIQTTGFTVSGLQNQQSISELMINYGLGATATTPAGLYPNAITAGSPGGSNFTPANYGPVIYQAGDLTVDRAPLVIKANNASRVQGAPDPVFTIEYTGFVNNEGPAVLLSLPVVSSTATAASVPGTYSLQVSDAAADNYTISYIEGKLTINADAAVALKIPNTFTPNGDGINDTWDIGNIANYPNCRVTIFDRYGRSIYYSIGYPKAWSGQYKGTAIPTGTYYFLINLNNNTKPLGGSITIIR